jgi:protein-disulfide isomerase
MDRRRERSLAAVGALAAVVAFVVSTTAGLTAESKKETGQATVAAAAVVGDRTITLEELDAKASGRLAKVRLDEYEIRQSVLDKMIDDVLLEREAKARGMNRLELIETEVAAKVPDPANGEIDIYYRQNQARYGAKSKEEVQPQIVALLRARKMGDVQREFLYALRKKHGAQVFIAPPRTEVSVDDDASKGPANAPVTIVEFSDYQCQYCSRAEPTIAQVLKKYAGKVRFVYRDFPLSFHENAELASTGAECAEEQGEFWKMHAAMFADQERLAADDLVETAVSIGLEKEAFKSCIDSGKYKEEVQNDFRDGKSYGVTGTPTFFINGIMLVGAKGPQKFSEIIDRELERAED